MNPIELVRIPCSACWWAFKSPSDLATWSHLLHGFLCAFSMWRRLTILYLVLKSHSLHLKSVSCSFCMWSLISFPCFPVNSHREHCTRGSGEWSSLTLLCQVNRGGKQEVDKIFLPNSLREQSRAPASLQWSTLETQSHPFENFTGPTKYVYWSRNIAEIFCTKKKNVQNWSIKNIKIEEKDYENNYLFWMR